MIPIITHKASFSRLTLDVDSDKEGWVEFLTGIPCNIQPASPNPSELATGVFDKKHIMFLSPTYSGIREGYRTTISGLYDGMIGRDMTVEGVEDWNNGVLPHYQLTLSEIKE